MSTFADFTITKADDTTNVTYQAIKAVGDTRWWREVGPSNEESCTVLQLINLPTKRGSKELRKRFTVFLPVMEVVTGNNSSGYSAAPKIAFPIRYNVDGLTTTRATTAQNSEARNLVRKCFIASTASGQFTDAFDKNAMPN